MSNLQKWCPNYAKVCILAKPGGCLYTVLPRCPPSVLAPDFLEGIPRANAKVQVCLPTCILQGRGSPRATRHEHACLLHGQNLDYHCHCQPKP